MPASAEQKTALFRACEEGSVEEVQRIATELGEDVKTLHADDGANCLHLAARAGRTELCTLLLDQLGFDINAQDGG